MNLITEHIEKNQNKYRFAFVNSIYGRFYVMAFKDSSQGFVELFRMFEALCIHRSLERIVDDYGIIRYEGLDIDADADVERTRLEKWQPRLKNDLSKYKEYDILSVVLYELDISDSGNKIMASQLKGIVSNRDKKWALLHCKDNDPTVCFICRRIMGKEDYLCL